MAWGFIVFGCCLLGAALGELIARRYLNLTPEGQHRLVVAAIISTLIGLMGFGAGRLDRYYGAQLHANEQARLVQANAAASDMMDNVFTNTMNLFSNNILSLSSETGRLEFLFRQAAKATPSNQVAIAGHWYDDPTQAIKAILLHHTKLVNKIIQTDANLNTEYATLTQNTTDNSTKQMQALRLRRLNAESLTKIMLHYNGDWPEHVRLYNLYSNAMFY
jgi:hypothetical protein